MKSKKKRIGVLTALAVLCLTSMQASAAPDDQDVVFDCKVRTSYGGNNYYLRSNALGKLVFTSDASAASVFTFVRDPNWYHGADGTSYYMIVRNLCVGLGDDADATRYTKLESNWSCLISTSANSDLGARIVRVDNINSTEFSLRLKSNMGLYFSGVGNQVSDGLNVTLDTRPTSSTWRAGQKFGTVECRDINFNSYRPEGGT